MAKKAKVKDSASTISNNTSAGKKIRKRLKVSALSIGTRKKIFRLKMVGVAILTLILFVGCYFYQKLNAKPLNYIVQDGFYTVLKEVPTDGSEPTSHSALDNVAYLNYVFKNQPYFYMEMHGNTTAMGINQEVSSYKQKNDGVLIVTEITSSSMVNNARQYCYINDEIIWRNSKNNNFNGLDTEWKTGDPAGHMNSQTYIDKYGLPGSEFLAYVINEDTLISATEVTKKEDGNYSMTLSLDVTDKSGAAAYYAKQMVFAGGLNDYPVFDYINITFTFDGDWRMQTLEVNEAYNATMGISVYCTSLFRTDYFYDQEKSKSDAYDEYFKEYEKDDFIETPTVVAPSAAGCLGAGFSSVLTGPTTFNVNLNVGENNINGVVYLDVASAMQSDDVLNSVMVRADLGKIKLWLEQGIAFLQIDGIKIKLSVDEALSLVGELLTSTEEVSGGLNFDDLLADLGGGEFTYEDKKSANLNSELSILGINLPLQFSFNLDDKNNPTLNFVKTNLEISGVQIGAELTFGNQVINGLSEEEKNEFIDLLPIANTVIEVLNSEILDLDVNVAIGEVKLEGNVLFALKELDVNDLLGSLKLSGNIAVEYSGVQKQLFITVENGVAFIEVEGIKIKATIQEAIDLIQGLIPAQAEVETGALNLDQIVSAVLGENFLKTIILSQNESTVTAVVKLNEALSELGISLGEFGIGDIELAIDNLNKSISLNAGSLTVPNVGNLAVSVGLKSGEEIATIEEDEYVDLLTVVNPLMQIVSADVIEGVVNYSVDKLTVQGNVLFSINSLTASADLTLIYGQTARNVEIIYANDNLYLNIMGLKVKANTVEAIELISQAFNVDLGEITIDEQALIQSLMTTPFDALLEISKGETAGVDVLIKTNKLLELLGATLSLGDAKISIHEDRLTASALGVNLTISASNKTVAQVGENQAIEYLDVVPALKTILEIVNKQGVALSGNIQIDIGETAITLTIEEGVVTWENQICVTIKGQIEVANVLINFSANITGEEFKIALGQVGVCLAYTELDGLENALVQVYQEIYDIVGDMSDTENPLPQISGINDIIALIQASNATVQTANALSLNQTNGEDLIESILSSLVLANNNEQGGILTANLQDIILSLYSVNEKTFSAKVNANLQGIKLSALLNVKTLEEENLSMPDINYLSDEDFVEILDYASALINTLTQQNLTLNLQALTTTNDLATYPDGMKQKIDVKVDFYSGDTMPLRFNLDSKSIYFSTDLFLHLYLGIEDLSSGEGNDLYFDVWLFDKDGNGVLDAVVQVSKFGVADSRYAPLVVSASTDELMSIISSALAIVGLDQGFLHDWIVDKWLSVETAEQLRAIGESLFKSFDFSELLNSVNFDIATESENKTILDNLLLLNLSKDEFGAYNGGFNLQVSSDIIFGLDLGDLILNVQKYKDESGKSLIKVVTLDNVWLSNGDEKLSISLENDYQPIDTSSPIISDKAVSYNVEGVKDLLSALSKGITHKDGDGKFILNENFYIDGNADLKLNLISIINQEVKIRVIGLSIFVDEQGQIAVNICLKYDHLKVVYDIINGDTVLDVTIKNNMLYMKRTQTTNSEGKALATPEVLYRAMPLANIASNTEDILSHIGFMFNLGDDIMKIIKDNVKGDDSTQTTTGIEDIGTTVKGLISSVSFNNNSWTLSLNGANLTGGVLGDITVKIGTDENGLARTFELNTGISVTGVDVSIKANLKYRNPNGIMDSGVTDITTDVAGVLESAMSKKINEMNDCDWKDSQGNLLYLEGKLSTVSYFAKGDKIAEQQIVINPNTFELYADIIYPDVTAFEERGYSLSWTKFDSTLQISLLYSPNSYVITFESEQAVEGWNGVNGFTNTLTYVYGETFILPFASTKANYISHFVDGQGNVYLTSSDMLNIYEDTVLYAVWKPMEYVVTFTDGVNVIDTVTVEYGKDIPSVTPTDKTGYEFIGWDTEGVVTDNVTVTAKYTPCIYNVTLLSDYEIEGYALNADGKYYLEIPFTYDSTVSLAQDVRVGSYALNGFRIEGVDELYVYNIPNVTKDTVMVAEWQLLGGDVEFVQEDGSSVIINRPLGSQISLSQMPVINYKEGYTGAWAINGEKIAEGYTINSTEKVTVNVIYTANDYTVSVYSKLPIDGYSLENGVYVRKIVYTFNQSAVAVDMGEINNVSGYWFKGIYTAENGAGEVATHYTNQASNASYYIYWQDNTVTVRFYSDIKFEGSTFDVSVNGYYVEKTYNDNYDVNYGVSVNGYQQLGKWWHNNGGAWGQVTNVEKFHGQEGVKLWALWIQNINVSITQVAHNKVLGNLGTYAIGGEVVGGLPAPNMSKTIYEAMGGQRSTMVTCVIYDKNGANGDNCGGGQAVEVNYDAITNVGTFDRKDMNSATYSGASSLNPVATYGGVEMVMTFSLGGESISVTDTAIVSVATYTVTVKNSDGSVLKTISNVRLGCSANNYLDATYLDELLAKNGVTVQEIEGHNFVGYNIGGTVYGEDQLHMAITGNTEITLTYDKALYQVAFTSQVSLGEGWVYSQDLGLYGFTGYMRYQSTVSFVLEDGSIVTYTVSTNILENVFAVPNLTGGVVWGEFGFNENGFTVLAKDGSDFVTLSSQVAFNYSDGVNQASQAMSYKVKYKSNYTLATPTANGHVFLGWWMLQDGVYTKITELTYSNGEELNVTVEALWATELLVSYEGDKASKSWGNHIATVNVSGGKLVSSFASQIGGGTLTYRYWAKTDGSYAPSGSNSATGKADVVATTTNYVGSSDSKKLEQNLKTSIIKYNEQKHVNTVVTLCYTYNGQIIFVGNDLGGEIGVYKRADVK